MRSSAVKKKNLPANAGDTRSIPGSGRSPGEGNGYPLQYSCLGNPMDRGAWWATVHKVAESDTPEHLSEHTAHALKREIPPAFSSVSKLFWLFWDLRIFVWIFWDQLVNFCPKKGKKASLPSLGFCLGWVEQAGRSWLFWLTLKHLFIYLSSGSSMLVFFSVQV